MFRVWGLGIRVQSLGIRNKGLEFGVWSLGFRAWIAVLSLVCMYLYFLCHKYIWFCYLLFRVKAYTHSYIAYRINGYFNSGLGCT